MSRKIHKSKSSKVKQWVVPTKHNSHHPHVLRKHGLIAIALLLIGLQFVYNVTIARDARILGYATNVSSQEVIADINSQRTKNKVSTLKVDSQLSTAAGLKADDMFKKGYWAHNSPDGTQPWKWFEAAGYKYQLAGENLAKDFRTSNGVTAAWLDSETHRKNMLNPDFNNIGLAVVNGTLNGQETTLVVAMFGNKQPTQSVAQDSQTAVSTTDTGASSIFSNPAQIKMLTNPVSLLTVAILVGLLAVALLTHWHYIKLPKKVRKAWYKHHAFYTANIALLGIVYVAYIFTSGTI